MGRGWKRARQLSTAPVPYPTKSGLQRTGPRLACRSHLQARRQCHRMLSIAGLPGLQSFPGFLRPQPEASGSEAPDPRFLALPDGHRNPSRSRLRSVLRSAAPARRSLHSVFPIRALHTAPARSPAPIPSFPPLDSPPRPGLSTPQPRFASQTPASAAMIALGFRSPPIFAESLSACWS